MALSTGKECPYGINRIAWRRHQDDIAGVDKCKRNMADSLLGPNQREHLCFCIKSPS